MGWLSTFLSLSSAQNTSNLSLQEFILWVPGKRYHSNSLLNTTFSAFQKEGPSLGESTQSLLSLYYFPGIFRQHLCLSFETLLRSFSYDCAKPPHKSASSVKTQMTIMSSEVAGKKYEDVFQGSCAITDAYCTHNRSGLSGNHQWN